MSLDVLVTQFANFGLTIFGIVFAIILVNWLDRNVFNKTRRKDDDKWD